MTLDDKLTSLKRHAREADSSGSGTLSTVELKNAAVPTKATALVASIGAEAGNSAGGLSLEGFEKIATRFASDFKRAATDGDGSLSKKSGVSARYTAFLQPPR